MASRRKPPQLAIDFHNDESGGLHVSRPEVPNLQPHVDRMKRLDQLLRKHTWFTEGSSGAGFRTPAHSAMVCLRDTASTRASSN